MRTTEFDRTRLRFGDKVVDRRGRVGVVVPTWGYLRKSVHADKVQKHSAYLWHAEELFVGWKCPGMSWLVWWKGLEAPVVVSPKILRELRVEVNVEYPARSGNGQFTKVENGL